jgi:hypothetical protein
MSDKAHKSSYKGPRMVWVEASNTGDHTIPAGYTPLIDCGYGSTIDLICVKLFRATLVTQCAKALGPAQTDVLAGEHGFFLMDGRTSKLAVYGVTGVGIAAGDWLAMSYTGTCPDTGVAQARGVATGLCFAQAEKASGFGIGMIPAIIMPWRL